MRWKVVCERRETLVLDRYPHRWRRDISGGSAAKYIGVISKKDVTNIELNNELWMFRESVDKVFGTAGDKLWVVKIYDWIVGCVESKEQFLMQRSGGNIKEGASWLRVYLL